MEEYDATALLNAPFTVWLVNSAKAVLDEAGALTDLVIPDPDGLNKAVAQSRVLHPHKLTGPDIKFLRSALGMKSKDLAAVLAVTPEHMSRSEAGDKVLSPQTEMLLRIYTFVKTLPFTPKKRAAAEKVAEQVGDVFSSLSIKAAHPIEDKMVLYFERRSRIPVGELEHGDDDKGCWEEPSKNIAA